MLTGKYQKLKIFPTLDVSTPQTQGISPKLSINKSAVNLFKESTKFDEIKLPSLKFYISSNDSTNNNSSFDVRHKKILNKKFSDSFLSKFYGNDTKMRKRFGNRFKKFLKDKENNNENKGLKLSNSTINIMMSNFKKYKIKDDLDFHKKLMEHNNEKINNNIINEMKEPEDSYIKNIDEDPSKKPKKMGIFGSRNNMLNIIRYEMERLKYDNLYKDVKVDIKELIKDEIMDAQVKLKRKPVALKYNKKLERPLYLKKMDRYRYISSMNKIRQLNQIANISVIEEDGNIMKKLANDAYDALTRNRGKNKNI